MAWRHIPCVRLGLALAVAGLASACNAPRREAPPPPPAATADYVAPAEPELAGAPPAPELAGAPAADAVAPPPAPVRTFYEMAPIPNPQDTASPEPVASERPVRRTATTSAPKVAVVAKPEAAAPKPAATPVITAPPTPPSPVILAPVVPPALETAPTVPAPEGKPAKGWFGWLSTPVLLAGPGAPFPWMIGVAAMLLILLVIAMVARALTGRRPRATKQTPTVQPQSVAAPAVRPSTDQTSFVTPMVAAAAGAAVATAAPARMIAPAEPVTNPLAHLAASFARFDPLQVAPPIAAPLTTSAPAENPLRGLGASFARFPSTAPSAAASASGAAAPKVVEVRAPSEAAPVANLAAVTAPEPVDSYPAFAWYGPVVGPEDAAKTSTGDVEEAVVLGFSPKRAPEPVA